MKRSAGERPTISSNSRARCAGGAAGQAAVVDQRAHEAVEHRVGRVERREGVLEDHLDVPAVFAQPPAAELVHPRRRRTRSRRCPGARSPVTRRAIVLLPLPLWPTSAVTRPFAARRRRRRRRATLRGVPAAPALVGLADVVDPQDLVVATAPAVADQLDEDGARGLLARRAGSCRAGADRPRRASRRRGRPRGRRRSGSARGASTRQIGITSTQRGAKGQAFGGWVRSGGRPGM